MTDKPQIMAGCTVLVEERRQRLLDLLSERGFAALGDLAQVLETSESTIRRDLDYWDERGVIRRTHGGALFLTDSGLPALEERSSRALEEKQLIAKAAAGRIQDGDAILLDGGTSTLEVARLLVGRPLQIVTNSLPIANLFANSRETDLVILGGFVYPKTGVALGPLTVKMMEGINVRQTLMSVGGITAKGLFNSNLLLVETELAMMRCADEVVVVADHTKIGRQALAFLCPLPAIDTLDRGSWPDRSAACLARSKRRARAGRPGRRQYEGIAAMMTLDRAQVERLVRQAVTARLWRELGTCQRQAEPGRQHLGTARPCDAGRLGAPLRQRSSIDGAQGPLSGRLFRRRGDGDDHWAAPADDSQLAHPGSMPRP